MVGPAMEGPNGPGALTLERMGIQRSVLMSQKEGLGFVSWVKVEPTAEGLAVLGDELKISVEETGSVPFLEVKNESATAVLLPEGWIMAGGFQTRMIERTLIIERETTVQIPVRCVEAGRWSPRNRKYAKTFVRRGRSSMKMRSWTKQAKVQRRREGKQYSLEQQQVWAKVDEELASSRVHSATASYEAYMDTTRKQIVEQARKSELKIPDDANGVLIQVKSGMYWFEVFPTYESLQSQRDEVLADLYDLQSDTGDKNWEPDNVEAILKGLWVRSLEEIDPVEGTKGKTLVLEQEEAAGEIVLSESDLAYMAVCGMVTKAHAGA